MGAPGCDAACTQRLDDPARNQQGRGSARAKTITLYTFGPAFGLPDMSPFVTKVEMLLKLAGLEYETDMTGFNKAPNGKLPYIAALYRRRRRNRRRLDFCPLADRE